MANNVIVSVEGFMPAVMSMVQENIDDNKLAIEENLTLAANAARDMLMGAPHNSGGGSDRGTKSLSNGAYDSGWHVYLYRWYRDKLVRVVANRHQPKMTHLLEFGHKAIGEKARGSGKDPRFYGTRAGCWVHMARVGTKTAGDKAIAHAYESTAALVRGGR